jgi:arylsulfatase A-like enzyme
MHPDVDGSRSDYYETPRFHTFASEGIRFSNGYSSGTVCSPSRASIQTGKTPAQLNLTDIIEGSHSQRQQNYYRGKPLAPPIPVSGLPLKEITIAEFLKQHRPDYTTGHFGKWHLASGGPGKHGYDVHDGDTGNSNGKMGAPNPKDTFGVSLRASKFMAAQVAAKRPFLVQVSYYAVHRNIAALKSTEEKYEAKPKGQHHSHVGYAAMTEDLDTGIGQILDSIDELGIRENTYVIYASDNGAYRSLERVITSNAPLSGGKGSVLEGGIRVPFAIRGPGIEAGGIRHTPVVLHDLFPTISELVGITAPLPDGIEGGSLVDLIRQANDEGQVKRPYKELVWHFPHYIDTKALKPQSAIRDGEMKLVFNYESRTSQLYDLADDISESKDLSSVHPKIAKALRAKLFDYLQAVGAHLPLATTPGTTSN